MTGTTVDDSGAVLQSDVKDLRNVFARELTAKICRRVRVLLQEMDQS